MELTKLTESLQILCHEGLSNSEVVINVKGFTTAVIDEITVDKDSERVLINVGI